MKSKIIYASKLTKKEIKDEARFSVEEKVYRALKRVIIRFASNGDKQSCQTVIDLMKPSVCRFDLTSLAISELKKQKENQ